ncbi:hypothetical protein FB451DRAFT_1417920 [Mycena latifolia]|nr:hypothetical protein FB451DRAFT_1417920 [Mycena latifolia]
MAGAKRKATKQKDTKQKATKELDIAGPYCRLHVMKRGETDIYIKVPIPIAKLNCRSPMKYLTFLGSIICGAIGHVEKDMEDGWKQVDDNAEYERRAKYRYIVPGRPYDDILKVAVNPLIRRKTASSLTATSKRDDSFKKGLLARDKFCVFTHRGAEPRVVLEGEDVNMEDEDANMEDEDANMEDGEGESDDEGDDESVDEGETETDEGEADEGETDEGETDEEDDEEEQEVEGGKEEQDEIVETEALAIGSHIFPHARAEWLGLLPSHRGEMRTHDPILDIDDPRNGLLLDPGIHSAMDWSRIVILKTPNRILNMDDVPRPNLWALSPQDTVDYGISFPTTAQHTLQFLDKGKGFATYKHKLLNADAAFVHGLPEERQPSELFLHYMYAVSVLHTWGKAEDVDELSRGRKRPVAVPAPMGPPKMPAQRGAVIAKRLANQEKANEKAGGSNLKGGRVVKRLTMEDATNLLDDAWAQRPETRRQLERQKQEFNSDILAWRARLS